MILHLPKVGVSSQGGPHKEGTGGEKEDSGRLDVVFKESEVH